MRLPTLMMVLAILPSAALAQGEDVPAADPTAHRHVGFYVHVEAGVGYLRSSASVSGTTVAISSVSIPIAVSLGGAVTENWILAGEAWGSYGPTPKMSAGSSPASVSDTDFYLSGFGLAVVHYIMPANVFLSLTPGVTRISIESGGTKEQTELGFGAKLALGKEWWVSDHWGLGLAVHGTFGLNSDQGSGTPTWTTLAGGVTSSAIWN